jgi:lipoprotein-anchoring transpeptidase ErfK/SrfK
MNVDYYSLLTKAVAAKDAIARNAIYKDTYDLIQNSNLPRSEIPSHIARLEDAARRIESDIAARSRYEEKSAAAIDEVLSGGRSWRPLALSVSAVIAVIALSALLYGYLATKDRHGVVTASLPQRAQLADLVIADLEPGVDGGSSAAELPFAFQRQVVFYRTTIVPGSIVIDRESRFLYLIDYNNSARRYGIGIAQECLKGGSLFRVTSKLEWPQWRPSGSDAAKDAAKDATKSAPALLASVARPGNPLGSRALVTDRPGLIIHGTNSPKTIGHLVASGCIRLVNEDVEDLYRRVSVETRVIFVS